MTAVVRYTNDQRQDAGMMWMSLGSYTEVSEKTGIHVNTLRGWERTADEFWERGKRLCQNRIDRQVTGKFNRMIEKGAEHVIKILEDPERADKERLKDIAWIVYCAYDKVQGIKSTEESKDKESLEAQLKRMQREFERMAKDRRPNLSVVGEE